MNLFRKPQSFFFALAMSLLAPASAQYSLNDFYVMQQAEFTILCNRRTMSPTLVRIVASEPGTYTIPNVSSVCAGKI